MKSSFKARTFWIWQLPLDNQKCFCFIDVVVVTFLTNRQNVCSSGWLPFKAEAWSYWPSNDRIFFLRPVRHKLTKGMQFMAISFVFSFEDPGYSWSIYRYPQTCYNCCSFQRNNVLNVFFFNSYFREKSNCWWWGVFWENSHSRCLLNPLQISSTWSNKVLAPFTAMQSPR